jgi:surfeit locus 1 family protein
VNRPRAESPSIANIAAGGRQRPHAPWVLAVLALVALALFVGFLALGAWQVQRRAWKLDLLERVEQRIHAVPTPPPAPSQWEHITPAEHEYLAVRLQGQWLTHKTALTQATTVWGSGFWVMTPLQLQDGTQVLVNRGFVPEAQRSKWTGPAASSLPTDTVTVEGLLRMSEPGGGFLRRNDPAQQRWFSRDVAALAQALALPRAAPYFVDAGFPQPGGALNTEQRPPSSVAWPQSGLTVVRFPNSHLVYAITWFGLAIMVAAAAVLVARYERRLRVAHGSSTPHEHPH